MLERVRCPKVSSGKAGHSRRSLSVHYPDREFHQPNVTRRYRVTTALHATDTRSCEDGQRIDASQYLNSDVGVAARRGRRSCLWGLRAKYGRIERQGPITVRDNVFESNTNPDRRIGFFEPFRWKRCGAASRNLGAALRRANELWVNPWMNTTSRRIREFMKSAVGDKSNRVNVTRWE